MEKDKKTISCQDCPHLGTYTSEFYDDNFVDFICHYCHRSIKRVTSTTIPDIPTPKWCPLKNKKETTISLDDDDDFFIYRKEKDLKKDDNEK